eukprot:symbB.v1.2.016335.t1/scaffold1222.1/size194531/9
MSSSRSSRGGDEILVASLCLFQTQSFRGASAGSASHPGHSQDGAGFAAWISIDPRTGELSQYPDAAAHRGRERQVRLSGLGLGSVYESIIVDLGGPGEPPVQKRVGGGKRDVRRFEVARHGPAEVRVHIVRDRGWRICDEAVPGVTEERIFSLDSTSTSVPPPAPPPPPPPPPEFLSTYRKPLPEELEELWLER